MTSVAPFDELSLRKALLEHLELKELPRAGWQREKIAPCESVAAHSWGVAWLVLLLCPPELDRGRALAIAIAHDVAEVRTGDITPHDGVSREQKRVQERQAMNDLVAALPRENELMALSEEYGNSPEGQFVKACDKLDMALQALRYRERDQANVGEFLESASAALAASPFPQLRRLLR